SSHALNLLFQGALAVLEVGVLVLEDIDVSSELGDQVFEFFEFGCQDFHRTQNYVVCRNCGLGGHLLLEDGGPFSKSKDWAGAVGAAASLAWGFHGGILALAIIGCGGCTRAGEGHFAVSFALWVL